MPFLGGSVITISGSPFSITKLLLSIFFISPNINSELFILFSFEFSSADLIASGTDSIPIIFLHLFER